MRILTGEPENPDINPENRIAAGQRAWLPGITGVFSTKKILEHPSPLGFRRGACYCIAKPRGFGIMDQLFEALNLPADRKAGEILRLLIEIGLEMLRADQGSLLLYDPAAGNLVFVMTAGDGNEALIGRRLAVGSGIAGMAAQSGELQIGAKDRMLRLPGDGEPNTVIAAPIMARNDDLLGVMTLVSFDPERFFTLKEGEFYLKLAAVAGVVIDQQKRLNAALPPELRELAQSPARLAVFADLLRNLERLNER